METTRRETLIICIGLTFFIAIVILYTGIWSLKFETGVQNTLKSPLPVPLWITGGLLLLGALLSFELRTRSVPQAGWALSLAVCAGICVYLLWFDRPYGVLAFLLPMLYAAFLFEWKQVALFITKIGLVSTLLNIFLFREGSLHLQVVVPVVLLLSIATFIEFAIHTLFSDLDWYEKNYVSAHQKELIIRDNETKLQRLVKDLNITNLLLAKAQNEAEKAKNAKQIFAQTVSHELRTPLNLIIGFSETMFNTPGSYAAVNWTPELRTDVECIYKNSQHLKSLIDDVLDLASLENRSYEINPLPVDLNAIILEATFVYRDRYANKGLFLQTELGDQAIMVHADPVRIRQVILNLLSNALKYTASGGVTITAQRAQYQAQVDVQDSGKGIPADALDKVFEAFYQVDKSRNREDSGTGLGLTISKQLVELHGGEMRISSILGKGSVVSFSLPLVN